MFECPTCGKSFDTERGGRVHHWRSHGERLANRTCSECGDQFYSEYEQKYCSSACREVAVSHEGAENPNYKGGTESETCRICGTAFEYYPSEKSGVYCTACVDSGSWQSPPVLEGEKNPRWNGGKQTVDCTVCGTGVERYPSQTVSAVFCSRDCRATWLSEQFSGDGHPNWKGGGNLEYGTGWREARSEALDRDGYECQLCESTREELGRNPDVHHIIPVRCFVDSDTHTAEDAHFLANLISLCSSCHRRAESGSVERDDLRSLIGAPVHKSKPKSAENAG
ncbi:MULTISPECIES: HNH endonuclease [Halobacterium]|uniref:HNH endonuclease n=1 Tax=Halobacterium TaxID=2239 RepID=UPI0009EA4BE1|nr:MULTISPECIES: HNH endonuclease [Halobacterium]MCG1004256.1 HNH endonuclease [Halobacterium noricense]